LKFLSWLKKDIEVATDTNGKVENVWIESPDLYNGSTFEVDFIQKGEQLTFKLPSLKYWDMVVIEYKK
jgi:dextranase